tara:strand:+ start:2923 stop:3489 length:567 start_codon:yes stop_codon:yes gene_type:complete
MALSKIQAESMNLADTFAFTGTVTGTLGWTETASIGTLDSATETITGLPSTITELYMVWDSVTHSSDTPDNWGIRLGTSGGIVTSGYKSSVNWIYDPNNVVGHVENTDYAIGRMGNWGSGSNWSGQFYFWNIASNTWVYNGIVRDSDGDYDVIEHWAGRVALGGTLDRISVSVSAGTINGGTIKAYYK